MIGRVTARISENLYIAIPLTVSKLAPRNPAGQFSGDHARYRPNVPQKKANATSQYLHRFLIREKKTVNPRRMIGGIAVRTNLLDSGSLMRWSPRKKSAEVARRSAERLNFPANCLILMLWVADISGSLIDLSR